MKIKKDENIIRLIEQLDASSNPMLAIYSNGDPEQNPDSHAILLPQVSRESIFSLAPAVQDSVGQPTRYSILHDLGKTKLALWPRPDKEYHALFEFNPPRKRI